MFNWRVLLLIVLYVVQVDYILAMNIQNSIDKQTKVQSENQENFDDYFKRIAHYRVNKGGRSVFREEGHGLKGIEFELKNITQNFINRIFSLEHFYDLCPEERNELSFSYLDYLFFYNLGGLAEAICTEIQEKTGKLPEHYNLLLKIQRGENVEISQEIGSDHFKFLAYRVANQSNNLTMVKKLYPLVPDLQERSEELKKQYPALYVKYIHEPYWTYTPREIKVGILYNLC